MVIRIGRLFACIFLFTVAGGHWGMMQLAAWSEMAATPGAGSVLDVVFASPCESCVAILEGSQEEKEDPGSAANAKGQLLAGELPRPIELFPPGVVAELDDCPLPLSGLRGAPATGPPRAC